MTLSTPTELGNGHASPQGKVLHFARQPLNGPNYIEQLVQHAQIEQPAPAGWQLSTLKDAYQQRAPISFVIDGLFKRPSVNVVYGAPGSLKSMLVADAALCVASGRPWLAPPAGTAALAQRKTWPAPVLWCDFDNGKRETDDRFDALGQAHGISPSVPFYFVSMPEPWLDLSNDSSEQMLDEQVAASGIKLLVIDNLGAVKGCADENSADMLNVMYAMRRIAERNDCAVVVIHHQRKSNGTNGRKGETMRGHSAIEQVPDLTLCVERGEGAWIVKVTPTKVRGAPIDGFQALFTYDAKLGRPHEMASARFFGIALEGNSDNARETAVAQTDEAILEVVAVGECNQSTLRKTVKERIAVSDALFKKRVDALIELGKLAHRRGEKNAVFYSLSQ